MIIISSHIVWERGSYVRLHQGSKTWIIDREYGMEAVSELYAMMLINYTNKHDGILKGCIKEEEMLGEFFQKEGAPKNADELIKSALHDTNI